MMGVIRRIITGVIVLFILLYGGYFSIRNMDTIGVSLPFFGDYRLPSFVAFWAAFVSGAIFSGLYFGLEIASKTMQVRRLRKEVHGSKVRPHKRARRFLREEEPETKPEPSIYSQDNKEF